MKVFILAGLVACASAGVHSGGPHAALLFKQGPPAFKAALPPPIPIKGVQENIVLSAELFPSAHDHHHHHLPPPPPPRGPAPTFIILKQGHLGGGHGGNFGGAHLGGPIGGHVAGIGKAHAVAGPSYLVSTVHHVQKVSPGGKYLGSIDGHAHDAWPAAGHGGKILVKGGPIPIGHGGGWQ